MDQNDASDLLDTVRSHPWTAVAILSFAGFVVGGILRDRVSQEESMAKSIDEAGTPEEPLQSQSIIQIAESS